MRSKSRTQTTGIPHAGIISGIGALSLIVGVIWLFLNLLNPFNWVVGIVGIFWGPAGILYILNVFMGPLILMAFGVIMLVVSGIRR